MQKNVSMWSRWVQQPQRLWVYNVCFQVHFAIGAMVSLYVALMSVTGSVIVFRDELVGWALVKAFVRFHTNLLAGGTGKTANGVGGVLLTFLCLTGAFIWWPGIKHWRRSLTISLKSNFARMSWDLHSALGFWSLSFLLVWGLSAAYFGFPGAFERLFPADTPDSINAQLLYWLAELHFGRFNIITKVIWSLVGLVPAVLAFTGVFVCCRRLLFKRPTNPYR